MCSALRTTMPKAWSRPVLRDAFCAAHACQKCGKCKVGPVRFALEGVAHRLRNDALFVVPDVRSEQAAGLRMLLEAQASILRASILSLAIARGL
jgi:hypothetical protein